MGIPSGSTQENFAVRAGASIFESIPLRMFALVVLLTAAPAKAAFSSTALFNGDIWWHLRTGLWILGNHSVPRSGLFSQFVDRSWVDSSWGFDVLVAAIYKPLCLRALPALLMGFKLAIAVATFLLALNRRGSFWCAFLLSAIAQYLIADLPALPMLFSIVFFAVELLVLLASRSSGDVRTLYWLPVVFFFWVNLHGQFLNGLLLLGWYLTAEIGEFLSQRFDKTSFTASNHSLVKVSVIALSVIATFLTPYGLQTYSSAFQTSYGKVVFENFTEMQAITFRQTHDFVLMLLVMAAFLALGRQHSRDLFKLGMMVIFVMLAFRVQRDAWCVVIPAVAVLADAIVDSDGESKRHKSQQQSKWEKPLVAVVVIAVFLGAISRIPSSNALIQEANQAFPVRACDFIRSNQLPAPLFNTYDWGGFLIWYLPEYPVSIDGRVSLYGDEINERYFKVTNGAQRLETDPSFTRARTVLLERNSGMLKALTTLPTLRDRFHVAYQDDVATVLVRQ